MKRNNYILFILLIFAILTNCKKEPKTPSGNKIEMGATVEDTTMYTNSAITSSVTTLAGNTITQHGHCWSVNTEPTIEDKHTSLGVLSEPKSFTSLLDSLESNTLYYVRLYLTYPNGVIYGDQISIKTLKTGLPILTTTDITNITLTSATCGGNVTVDSGLVILTKGVCWDTVSNVNIENNMGFTSDGDSLGAFLSEITDLNEGVNYYVKAYATNKKGTSYGEVLQFSTVPITLPTVTTTEITNITNNYATSGGNVTNDGNSSITARGVCWSIMSNPTLSDNHATSGTGTGSFTSSITGLTEITQYYVRAYATNSEGTAYGNEIIFTTLPDVSLPTVATSEVTYITQTTAISGGAVLHHGGGTVSTRGVCWNTTSNPTLENNLGYTINGSGIGIFTSNLSDLTPSTICYIVAYATNEIGTSYGNELSFETMDMTPCDGLNSFNYHGQTYNTIEIDYQCWMKENLNYETGDSWCYDNNPTNCTLYGRLYNWETVMNGKSSSNTVPSGVQGICPDGWHIPSDEEWKILEGITDTQYGVGDPEWDWAGYRGWDVGKRLKTITGWVSNTGTDAVGFSALPGGYGGVSFGSLGDYGHWWMATESYPNTAFTRVLSYDEDKEGRSNAVKVVGYSARCLKD